MGEMLRVFFLQNFKSLSDFSFVFGALADAFFKSCGLSEDKRGSGDGLEVLMFENDAILIIVDVSNLIFGKTREGISVGLCRTRFVDQFKVKFGEI